jgi:periplasmic divalent cation tolerance protein
MGRYDGRLIVCATTFPSRASAEEAVRRLVEEGLVVCGQVGADLVSFYRWRGEVQRDAEVAVLLKIRDEDCEAACRRLEAVHPYDVPQIVSWPATRVADAYGRWAWSEEDA